MALARLFVGFAILAVGFGAIEWRWPARVQPRWRRGTVADLGYWVFTPLVSRALAGAAVVAVAIAVAAASGVPLDRAHVVEMIHRPGWLAGVPRGAQIVLVLVVGDLVGYWLHRMFHRGRLWRFHAIHHSSIDLDWLSSTRLHPVNDIVQRALQAVVLLGIGFDPTVVAAFVPAIGLYAIALHANVAWSFGPLRYVIASPTFHRWHHACAPADINFAGLFPLWDLAFGTFHMPRGCVPSEFGVRDDVPDGLLAQLAWPFRRPPR